MTRHCNFSLKPGSFKIVVFCSRNNLPGIEQDGSFEKVKSVPAMHVISLSPLLTCSVSEHVTSTTVPAITGNCVVVSIVLVHSVFSPVHDGTVRDRDLLYSYITW